jgi:methyl coenzyme M reductase subunit D
MMDDIDRDCCSEIERVLTKNLPEEWNVVDRKFHDPGMTLTLDHSTKGFVGQPTVTVEITYGKKSKRCCERR